MRNNKWAEEKEWQRLLALAYVKEYCMEKGLSMEKLNEEKFELSYGECGFFKKAM